MNNPRIYLAIDNCFASKRWTKPSEWMKIIKEIGLEYVEASADTECDPLYTNFEYMEEWISEIKEYSKKTGIKVVNLYSGHGTYSTLGLAHNNKSVRERILNKWLKSMLNTSIRLDSGMGFFCHAFSNSVLQNPTVYAEKEEELYQALAELAMSANGYTKGYIGVEQMYTPHQIPWTIEGAIKLIKKVFEIGGSPFYITIDTGHQSGQNKFIYPDYEKIKELIEIYKRGERISNLWLGPETAYELFYQIVNNFCNDNTEDIYNLISEMEKYPYLFSKSEDGDTYAWLESLACYSPIIHLQQTKGNTSSHQPFILENNIDGIIHGEKVLNSIKKSYEQKKSEFMPPFCDKIYLTLEIFSGTSEINEDVLYNLKETVRYWRKYVPEDGLPLEKLLENL